MPLVSVVMPVYNGEKYVAEAIESILAQTFSDFEFLIVDDGSTDYSAAIIRGYQERDDRIRLVQLERNVGRASARNRGLAAACGEYYAIMDCDDVCLPDRFRKQVDFFQCHPDIGGLGTCAQTVNHDMTRVLYDREVPAKHALIALSFFLGYGFVGPTVMLRRELLSAVGGYESGRRVCEDLELFSRLFHESRINFANLPDCLYLYRVHQQLKFRNPCKNEHPEEREIKRRNLEGLWNEAPEASMDRLYRLRSRARLGWAERRAAKQDMRRLIDSLITQKWVEPGDKPLLIDAMNHRLEQASPRLWQQFCHWRRHHFQRR